MNMTYADTHCHLDFDAFDEDRDAVLERAKTSGLAFLINPGIDLASSQSALHLASLWPGRVYAACGFHPHYSAACSNKDALLALRQLASQPGVRALGEIGLDYYRNLAPQVVQREVFIAQLALAKELELPIIVHNRDADADTQAILLDWIQSLPFGSRLRQNPGVLHAFSGSSAMAAALGAEGFCFGIGGPITYANADLRREICSGLPLSQLLTETDAPYLTPHPYRGKRNEPGNIPLIIETLANLHQKDAAEIGAITTANARRVFGIV